MCSTSLTDGATAHSGSPTFRPRSVSEPGGRSAGRRCVSRKATWEQQRPWGLTGWQRGAAGGESVPRVPRGSPGTGSPDPEGSPPTASLSGLGGSPFTLPSPPPRPPSSSGRVHAITFPQLLMGRGREAGGRDVPSTPERGDTDSLLPSLERQVSYSHKGIQIQKRDTGQNGQRWELSGGRGGAWTADTEGRPEGVSGSAGSPDSGVSCGLALLPRRSVPP